MPNVNNMKFLM
ncbi:hypothetical protein CISIN_1g0362492mg, partial [Citrus sinensis]